MAKKPGPKPWRADAEILAKLKLWAGCGSTQEQCATMLDISIDTLKRNPDAKKAFEKGKAEAIAKIGGGVAKRAMAGSTSDAIFYLKTQAGWREPKDDSSGAADDLAATLAKLIESRPS